MSADSSQDAVSAAAHAARRRRAVARRGPGQDDRRRAARHGPPPGQPPATRSSPRTARTRPGRRRRHERRPARPAQARRGPARGMAEQLDILADVEAEPARPHRPRPRRGPRPAGVAPPRRRHRRQLRGPPQRHRRRRVAAGEVAERGRAADRLGGARLRRRPHGRRRRARARRGRPRPGRRAARPRPRPRLRRGPGRAARPHPARHPARQRRQHPQPRRAGRACTACAPWPTPTAAACSTSTRPPTRRRRARSSTPASTASACATGSTCCSSTSRLGRAVPGIVRRSPARPGDRRSLPPHSHALGTSGRWTRPRGDGDDRPGRRARSRRRSIANDETSGLAAGIVTEDRAAAREFLSAYAGTGASGTPRPGCWTGSSCWPCRRPGSTSTGCPGPRGPVTFRDLSCASTRSCPPPGWLISRGSYSPKILWSSFR